MKMVYCLLHPGYFHSSWSFVIGTMSPLNTVVGCDLAPFFYNNKFNFDFFLS